MFSNEYQAVKKGVSQRKGSKLASLDPFIDAEGLLRVGGRLQNSNLPYNQKHPILLLHSHHVTNIIINDAHLDTLHGGNKLTLALIRQKYWIIGGKRTIKSYINKCVKCIRYKASHNIQKMGILPKARVTESFPFSHTGIDYAGPIQVRAMKGRGHKSYKGYIAIFICLSTKAIHMELVGDLSTESFVAALRRFMARRGPVSHIYSDNATNFVGAANLLNKELLEVAQSSEFQNTMSTIGTQWHFIPPSSPHFGGIWEAAVKSMKYHLRRVIGEQTLTYEELSTFLHQTEACLNSRPLCAQSEDINDNIVLTPSHFLIGREAIGTPDPLCNINTDLLNRWKHIQKMKKDFWKSWTNDYLQQLQQRYKWQTKDDNLKIGTFVLIKDDNFAPSKWPLARVKEVHIGKDGLTRVVTLQKSSGATLKRSIHTLIPLPVQTINENNASVKPVHTNTTRKNIIHGKPAQISRWIIYLLLIMLAFSGTVSAKSYTIKSLSPGFYVEQIGTSTINRGTFRIETNYEIKNLQMDLEKITNVTTNFKQLCNNTETLLDETHCNDFYQHLEEKRNKFNLTEAYLSNMKTNRKKRGLLGQFLTSIFGVNDEVYKDIDALNTNQKLLIDSANHQTKIMISTISALNQTEQNIQTKMDRFQSKLNEAIAFINENNAWYKTIDKNHIKIQVMQAYHLANNFIEEIMSHYNGLLDIYLNNASIYAIMNPGHINNIIKMANNKLPNNLKIIDAQPTQSRMDINTTHIKVYGYYTIHDIRKYTLIHVTPVPQKRPDGSFECITTRETFLGYDYNNERYFGLTHAEFSDCLHINLDYVCYPLAVKNMQIDKSCIVEQLFSNENRSQTRCTSKVYKMTSDVVWKQLYMENTWLYITSRCITASIICDGKREEIKFTEVGVINIAENCILKTLNNILVAKRTTRVTVLASYAKATNLSMNTQIIHSERAEISREDVLNDSKGIFDHLSASERELQAQLGSTIWTQIKTHSYITSFSISLTMIMLICTTFFYGPQIVKCCTTRVKAEYRINTTEAAGGRQPQHACDTSQRPAREERQSEQGCLGPCEVIELYELEPLPGGGQNVQI